jgi:hypothetical protein
MQIASGRDWVTRTQRYAPGVEWTYLDLAHLGKHLPSDTHDIDNLIARGHVTVEARRISSALWNCSPASVDVVTQATSFTQMTPGFLTVQHVVAWPVTSKVSSHTYHVVRPVTALAAIAEFVLVTFADGETVRYHHTDTVWLSFFHQWGQIEIERRPVDYFKEQLELVTVPPYSDRHPLQEGEPLGKYCTEHDLFNCWYHRMGMTPPPPPPPLPATTY